MTEKLLTLDEIEANVQRARLRVSPMQDAVYAALDSIRALVAHVRALENGSDGPGRAQWGPLDRLRIAMKERDALRAENEILKESVVELGLRAGGGAASAVEEVTRLREENARLESRHRDQLAEGRAANARLTEERDRLSAENAELRKANENVQHVAAEYEERIKAMQAQVAQLRRDIAAGGWPALRLVHDPDTGCEGGSGCPLYDDHRRLCKASVEVEPFPRSGTPAPLWCPLRAGDVVVTAKKDGDM